MRISDWSSDVCSSDLRPSPPSPPDGRLRHCRKRSGSRSSIALSAGRHRLLTLPYRRAPPARSGLLALFREQFQAQSVELDEARRNLLVIGAGVVLEGDMALAVEAERRLAADDAGVALVKLEADGAGDVRRAMVDRRLQHLAFGREPEAVVDEIGRAHV